MKQLLAKAEATVAASPVNINKPGEVRGYVTAAMDPTEAIVLEESTKKSNLEAILNWEIAQQDRAAGAKARQVVSAVAARASSSRASIRRPNGPKQILDVKIAAKEVELYKKLLLAGKFHASFVVIGTLSSRMAGADGLNNNTYESLYI